MAGRFPVVSGQNFQSVPSVQNSADIRGRQSNAKNLAKEWWEDSQWLAYPEHRHEQKQITPTKESEQEAKTIK